MEEKGITPIQMGISKETCVCWMIYFFIFFLMFCLFLLFCNVSECELWVYENKMFPHERNLRKYLDFCKDWMYYEKISRTLRLVFIYSYSSLKPNPLGVSLDLDSRCSNWQSNFHWWIWSQTCIGEFGARLALVNLKPNLHWWIWSQTCIGEFGTKPALVNLKPTLHWWIWSQTCTG